MDTPTVFSEEEIRSELEKMGYVGFSDHVLHKFQKDLLTLMSQDQGNDSCTTRSSSPCQDQSVVSEIPKETTNQKYMNDDLSSMTSTKYKKQERVSDGKEIRQSDQSSKRIIKRKTLKYENGKAKVFEESYISTISETSYEDAPVHYYPDYDLEQPILTTDILRKSNSTGNLYNLGCPRTKTNPPRIPTTFPIVAYADKQCDPVTRYHQYKKYWELQEMRSEKSHKALRWSVREQMLDYDPIAEMSLKRMPNIFKIPKERRRPPLSRWNSCSSLPKQ